MEDLTFKNYLGSIVKVKLKDEDDFLIGKIIGAGGMQSFQPSYTSGNSADLEVIKDIALYKTDPEDIDNTYVKQIHREDVEIIEIININEL